MANLTQILDRIRSEASAGNNDAVQSLIAEAIGASQEQADEVTNLRAESKRRREKNDQLAAKITDLEDAATTLEKDKAEIARLKKVEQELNSLKQQESDKVVNAWIEKSKVFEIDKTDKRYEKIQAIKPKFKFGDDSTPLTAAEAAANLEKLELLETSGALIIPDTSTPNTQPPAPGKPGDAQPQYQSSGAAIAAQLYGNKKT